MPLYFKELIDKVKTTFSCLAPGASSTPCPAASVKTGLGEEVDALAAQSPTLQKNLATLKDDRWTVEYGDAGKGSFCDKKLKKIVVDPNDKANPGQIVQTLAHESGHALYSADPYVPPTGLTRQQYIDANIARSLKDEGEATLMNSQIRSEILKAGGADIGVAGAQASEYTKVFEKYPNAADRDTARQAIGVLFADGERPSTDPSKTYRDYYSAPFASYFDKLGGAK